MILAANQPYFLPYLGYWQLMNAADLFLIGDDYNYIDKGWSNRNRILEQGAPAFITLPVQGASSNRLYTEIEILPIDMRPWIKRLQMCYGKAPHFPEGIELMKEILSCKERNLVRFLMEHFRIINRYLGITTPIESTSQYSNYGRLKREERIYDYCARIGADKYYNPIGGTALYDKESFRNHGIELSFLSSKLPTYRQHGEEFIAGLSILDIIMFCSKEEIRKMLSEYELL